MSMTFWNRRRKLAALKTKENTQVVENAVEKSDKPKKGKVKKDG